MGLAPHVLSSVVTGHINGEDTVMGLGLKATMRASMLIALLVGFGACAKYPVVAHTAAPAPAPTAATQVPGR
jgi:hypothetical protein